MSYVQENRVLSAMAFALIALIAAVVTAVAILVHTNPAIVQMATTVIHFEVLHIEDYLHFETYLIFEN
jgi:hypothetical protein